MIPYNQPTKISPRFTERFLPGSIVYDDVMVNVQHIRSNAVARSEGGGLELTDGAQDLRASVQLPQTTLGMDTYKLIELRVLRGFSAEFQAIEEEWDGSERTIRQARLSGIGIVDNGAYAGATIEEVRHNLGGGGRRRSASHRIPGWQLD